MEKEVCNELVHSLHEWGVNRRYGDHAKFQQKAMRDCVANLSRKSKGFNNHKSLQNERFPKDYNEAYEHVLWNDEVPEKVYTYTDKLSDIEGYPEPFLRRRDQRTGEVWGYKVRREYQRCSSQELDPLQRFQFQELTKERLLFEEWFVDDNEDSSQGVLFEAILTCHVLQFEACYSCKFQKALRWNGGSSSSWQDIICTNSDCGATYEIKTKANLEKIENALRWNNINGGSFSAWCQLRNSTRPDQKHYIVVLPRKFTFNRQKEKVFPVTIAEIDKVLPKLRESSFNPNRSEIRFKSSVSIKLTTKAKWFDLPVTGQFIDMGKIAEKVFKDRFSEQTYYQLEDLYFGSDTSDDSESGQEAEAEESVDPVDTIANELKNVDIVPDDWEDLA
eukprot:CAMPEP_0183737128 /NCGR_PEP_ID=MMETSP0737-20130205/51098_1 /TAXON_ID=385413 /ORGANISM="Thalassiosira miniscula, Strain CCMP1093" /LENGTH=389 /DNA_ID=CAMNT_0025971333 /DNA_START=90 /DNA_END=1255 /DNA_ORIENTATION=+